MAVGSCPAATHQSSQEDFRNQQNLTAQKTIRLFAVVPGNQRHFQMETGFGQRLPVGEPLDVAVSTGCRWASREARFGVLPVFFPAYPPNEPDPARPYSRFGRRNDL